MWATRRILDNRLEAASSAYHIHILGTGAKLYSTHARAFLATQEPAALVADPDYDGNALYA